MVLKCMERRFSETRSTEGVMLPKSGQHKRGISHPEMRMAGCSAAHLDRCAVHCGVQRHAQVRVATAYIRLSSRLQHVAQVCSLQYGAYVGHDSCELF